MSEPILVKDTLADLRAYAAKSSDPALQEKITLLEKSLVGVGGSITVGNISGSTAVAVGNQIQQIVHQYQGNLPADLITGLFEMIGFMKQHARADLRINGRIRIYLALPGDVHEERRLALKAINRIQADPLYTKVAIEYKERADPDSDPMHAIKEGLPEPSKCDICVAVFWSQMGTPLDPEEYPKADGGYFLSATEWELGDAWEGARKNNGSPVVLVYRRTEKISRNLDAGDLEEKTRQWQFVDEFFARSKTTDDSAGLVYDKYTAPSQFADYFELRLRKEIVRLLEKNPPSDSTAPTPIAPVVKWEKGKSPFPGLRAFGVDDEPIFFGRGAEIDDMMRRIRNPECRFLAVVGASGSGKSSLVAAGLLPRLLASDLKGTEHWTLVQFKPDAHGNGDPFDALARALASALNMDAEGIVARLHTDAAALRKLLEVNLAEDGGTKRTVIFIDQFEELFTRIPKEKESLRQEFSLLLSEAAKSPHILTIVTMRDDYLARCMEYPVLVKLINENTSTYMLGVPGPAELYKMISEPADVAGLEFEPGLVSRILKETGTDPGALALMAYALDQLYNASKNSGKLTNAAYDAFQGVQGAIGMRAQETFDGILEKYKETMTQAAFEAFSNDLRSALTRVFRELLEVDESGKATRKRVPRERVEYDQHSRELVEKFREARLLVSSEGLVEVAHEALFRSWAVLAAWIEKTNDAYVLLRQVRAAAAEWDNKARKPEYLWLDERLKLVYEMQKLLEPTWKPHEKEFIRPEAERLLDEIKKFSTTHQRRSAIGERLDAIGDPRPGVGLVREILPLRAEGVTGLVALRAGEIRLWGDKPDHMGLPDIVWVKGRSGAVTIEEQSFKVRPFFIAKYPITYKQFEAFVEAEDGFMNTRWWQGLSDEESHKNNPKEQNFKFYNHPRETVSWDEAIAFCRWLNARMYWAELPINLSINALEYFKGVRLPTEWEWQWAAVRGNAKYAYPWGAEWERNKANTKESGLGRTTAVGMYPDGSAKCGALDMSGNVWEWCLNEYEKPEDVDLRGMNPHVLRGGSWLDEFDYARASHRTRNRDWYSRRLSNFGFRVVVSPPGME